VNRAGPFPVPQRVDRLGQRHPYLLVRHRRHRGPGGRETDSGSSGTPGRIRPSATASGPDTAAHQARCILIPLS